MAADSDDKHGAAENAMPTIDEKEALKINHKAMSAKPSSAHLGQPGSADPLLSNKTSAATLAPSAPPEGHVVSNRSSAATLVASAHRLGSSKPSVATLSPSRQTQASKQAGASSGGDQSGKSVLNLDHKTKFRHFLVISHLSLLSSQKNSLLINTIYLENFYILVMERPAGSATCGASLYLLRSYDAYDDHHFW